MRFWSFSEVTRIAVETNGSFRYQSRRLYQPDRVFFDLQGARHQVGDGSTQIIPVVDGRVKQIRVAENQPQVTRIVLDLEGQNLEVSTSQLSLPDRLMIEIRQKEDAAPSSEPNVEIRPSVDVRERSRRFETEPVAAVVPRAKPTARAFVFAGFPPLKLTPADRLILPPITVLPSRRASLRQNPTLRAMAIPQIAPPPGKYLIRRYRNPVTKEEPAVEAEEDREDTAARAVAARQPQPATPQPTTVAPEPLSTAGAEASGIPAATGAAAAVAAAPARTDSTGDRSLTRALGLKIRRVVIDPGHGGHDHGTTGPAGIVEKEVVLDVSKRLSAILQERMGSEVFLTRTNDTFIPLESRAPLANAKQADLFISVHVNSSPMRVAGGMETYYLSLTTSRAALEVAARENATSQRSVHELRDLLQKIALKDKVDESREFAYRVQNSLSQASVAAPAYRNRGVKRAPFVVLIGAQMPAILAEIGFVTNSKEELMMKKPEYRQKLAEALYRGISQYAASLSHFEVAQRKSAGSE